MNCDFDQSSGRATTVLNKFTLSAIMSLCLFMVGCSAEGISDLETDDSGEPSVGAAIVL